MREEWENATRPDGERRIDTGNSALVGCQDAIRGATRGKPPVSQSWHGFATLGLQRHFCDARQE
jgi:hypothetical protein